MRVGRVLRLALYILVADQQQIAAQRANANGFEEDLVGDRRLEDGSGIDFGSGSGDWLPPSSPASASPPSPVSPPPSPLSPPPSLPPPLSPPPSTPPPPLPPRVPPALPPSPVSPVPSGQQVYNKPTVKVNLQAAGDVTSYGSAERDAIKTAFVNATGVEQNRVSVDVKAGSVLIEVGIVVDTPGDSATTSLLLSSTLSNASAATAFLAPAGVVITGAPEIVQTTTLVVDYWSPPPPPLQPPLLSPSESNDQWKIYAAAAGGVIALIFACMFYCFCCSDPFNPFKGIHRSEYGGNVQYTASTQSYEMEDMTRRGEASSVAVPILAVKQPPETRSPSPSRPSISYTPREHTTSI